MSLDSAVYRSQLYSNDIILGKPNIKRTIFMKRNNIYLVSEKETYVSPSVRSIDIVSEGVLCSSGVDINDWGKDEDILEF